MLEILVVVLVVVLIVLVAAIAFCAGFIVNGNNIVEALKEKGWTVEPPEDGRG